MKQTNVTHNIRVDKNRSNRAVYEAWGGNEWPITDAMDVCSVRIPDA